MLPSASVAVCFISSLNLASFYISVAVKSGKFECVRLLGETGANLNSQLYCGTSALHQAASEGMVQVGCKISTKMGTN